MPNPGRVVQSVALKGAKRAVGFRRSGQFGSSDRMIGRDEIDPREAYAGFAALVVILILEAAALYPLLCR
jgi:hypothetical protein